MGVPLEIGKMFFYIMIPISFFHYYSHQDPEVFRKMRDDHQADIFGHGIKKSEEYTKKRAATEYMSADYNPKDAFWTYGAGLKIKEEMERAKA